jgi:hypothetical protein
MAEITPEMVHEGARVLASWDGRQDQFDRGNKKLVGFYERRVEGVLHTALAHRDSLAPNGEEA